MPSVVSGARNRDEPGDPVAELAGVQMFGTPPEFWRIQRQRFIDFFRFGIHGMIALRIALAPLPMSIALAAAPNDEKTEDREETELLRNARKKAESIKLQIVADGDRHELEMLEQPVLRFGDIPRANDKGSVWIWQADDRPQAIMELYRGTD